MTHSALTRALWELGWVWTSKKLSNELQDLPLAGPVVAQKRLVWQQSRGSCSLYSADLDWQFFGGGLGVGSGSLIKVKSQLTSPVSTLGGSLMFPCHVHCGKNMC